jgi:hypothetical protein
MFLNEGGRQRTPLHCPSACKQNEAAFLSLQQQRQQQQQRASDHTARCLSSMRPSLMLQRLQIQLMALPE